jgi:hypothetical protein
MHIQALKEAGFVVEGKESTVAKKRIFGESGGYTWSGLFMGSPFHFWLEL